MRGYFGFTPPSTPSSGNVVIESPTITSIWPAAGVLNGGNQITIFGTGFLSGVEVTFGGTACTSLVLSSSTAITCTTPAGSAGAWTVTATNSDTQTGSLSSGYTYQAAPTITSVTPSGGALAGGTNVTITGTGFLSGVGVTFGVTACTNLSRVSETTITCTTPAGSAGAVTVTATNSDTQTGSLSSGYTYQAAPTVTSIDAVSGTTAGGTSVTITGTGFLIGVGVTLGGSAGTVTSLNSSTSITATTPSGTAGAKDVVATNSDTQSGTLSSGYTYVNPGFTWSQEAYLKASNAGAVDLYGHAVSISGDTIVVVAFSEASSQTTITNGTTSSADNSASQAGAAYVYKRSGTTWSQEAYLKASNAEAGDGYGYAVSISGDTIVVGAYREYSSQSTITNGTTSSTDNSYSLSGAAYVYKRSGTIWSQEAYLKASNANSSDQYGQSVSISGDTLVVGAFLEDSSQTTITNGTTSSADNSANNSGAAYVYKRSGTIWSQEAYLKASNAGASDIYGYAVSISGDTLVVGAYGEASGQTTITNGTTSSADNSYTYSGAAYVYKRSGTTWSQEAYLKASNAEADDTYGSSVSLSGDTIVVGASYEDSNQTTITNGTGSSTDNSYWGSGAAYVYKRSGSTWSQEAYLKASNAEAYDGYGSSIGISGDTLVVGAFLEDSSQTTITNGTTSSADNSASQAGAAYVYKRSGSTWSQEAYLKASNAGASDIYGYAVSLSGDTLVVGAYGESSGQTTITNGTTSSADNSYTYSGAAYVYKRTQATGTPSVSSLSPSSGAAAGDNIIIFGGNFYSGAVASVGGVNCTTTTVQGPNEIICTLPTKPTSGALSVTVTNSDTTTGSLASAYTYP